MELVQNIDNLPYIDLETLENSIQETLDGHCPLKPRKIRANHKSYISQIQRKAIMTRARLKHQSNVSDDIQDFKAFQNQRNICTKLNRDSKRNMYSNLDPRDIENGKEFWKTFKPILSDKVSDNSKIILVHNDTIFSDDREIAEIFNNYFTNITKCLKLPEWETPITCATIDNPIQKAIERYINHPSITVIKNSVQENPKFNFKHVLPEDIQSVINKLKINKSTRGNLPLKIVKETTKVCLMTFADCLNSAMDEDIYPDQLKLADITPLLKKGDSTLFCKAL